MQFAPRIELSRKYCFNEMIFNFNSKLLCPCPYCRYVRRFSKRFRMRKNAHHLHNHSNMEGLIHLTIMFFVRAFMVFQTFCAWMQRSWFAKCKLNCFRKIIQKENGDECLKEGERERERKVAIGSAICYTNSIFLVLVILSICASTNFLE